MQYGGKLVMLVKNSSEQLLLMQVEVEELDPFKVS